MAYSMSVTTSKDFESAVEAIRAALDPRIMSELSDGDAIADVAGDAAERLRRALETVAAQ